VRAPISLEIHSDWKRLVLSRIYAGFMTLGSNATEMMGLGGVDPTLARDIA
jgi:hypothetical protein